MKLDAICTPVQTSCCIRPSHLPPPPLPYREPYRRSCPITLRRSPTPHLLPVVSDSSHTQRQSLKHLLYTPRQTHKFTIQAQIRARESHIPPAHPHQRPDPIPQNHTNAGTLLKNINSPDPHPPSSNPQDPRNQRTRLATLDHRFYQKPPLE